VGHPHGLILREPHRQVTLDLLRGPVLLEPGDDLGPQPRVLAPVQLQQLRPGPVRLGPSLRHPRRGHPSHPMPLDLAAHRRPVHPQLTRDPGRRPALLQAQHDQPAPGLGQLAPLVGPVPGRHQLLVHAASIDRPEPGSVPRLTQPTVSTHP
jgi:hypothetical protein